MSVPTADQMLDNIERAPTKHEVVEYVDSLTWLERIKGAVQYVTGNVRHILWGTPVINMIGRYIVIFWWSDYDALAKECRQIAWQIPAGYAEQGVHAAARYDQTGNRLNKRRKKGATEYIHAEPKELLCYIDRYQYKIDTSRLAKAIHRYYDPETLLSISYKIRRPVSRLHDPQSPLDLWLTVGKTSAEALYLDEVLLDAGGRILDYSMDLRRGDFNIPIGVIVGRGSEMLWVDLTNFPHIKIGGLTQFGKSSAIRTIALMTAALYPPDRVKMVVCDPKQGASFPKFDKLPHLYFDCVASKGETMLTQLREVKNVIERRFEYFEEQETGNINTHNAQMKRAGRKAKGRIIVVVDELGTEININPQMKKELVYLVHYIEARGGGAGVHMFILTQDFGSDFVPVETKANVAFSMTTRTTDQNRSRVNIGVKGAEKIQQKGMFIAVHEGSPVTIISPYSPEMAKDKDEDGRDTPAIIAAIVNKWQNIETEKEVTAVLQAAAGRERIETMLEYAAVELGGAFHINKMYSQYARDLKMTAQDVKDTARDLEKWGILTVPKGKKGRWLITTVPGEENDAVDWRTIRQILAEMFPGTGNGDQNTVTDLDNGDNDANFKPNPSQSP